MARLAELLSREMADRAGAGELRISGLLDPAGATVELMQLLERAGPFGQAAPAPRFAFADQLIDSAATMGDSHLRLRFRSPGSAALEAVAWGAMTGPLGPALLGAKGRRFPQKQNNRLICGSGLFLQNSRAKFTFRCILRYAVQQTF
jgi:single-stranded-DNA-specific exonuclease